MPNIVSPGVYVIEKDISEYAPTVNSSVVGIVGFASKGPIAGVGDDKATLITSPNQLVQTFGEPSESIHGQGLEAALEILETTNTVYFVRVASDAYAADASSYVQLGWCPSIRIAPSGFGVSAPLYLKVAVTDNTLTYPTGWEEKNPHVFSIPSGTKATGTAQAVALRSVVGGAEDSPISLEYSSDSDTSGYLVGRWAGAGQTYMGVGAGLYVGASLAVSAFSDPAFAKPVSALVAVNASGDTRGQAGTTVSGAYMQSSVVAFGGRLTVPSGTTASIDLYLSGAGYKIDSLYPGDGYNTSTNSDGDAIGIDIDAENLAGPNFMIKVKENGVEAETFKCSFLSGTGKFIENVINTGEVNTTSQFIKGNLVGQDSATGNGTGADITASGVANFEDQLSQITGENAIGYTSFVVSDEGVATRKNKIHLNANPRFVSVTDVVTNMVGGNNGQVPTTAATWEAQTKASYIGTAANKRGLYALDDDLLNISMAIVPTTEAFASVQNALVTLAEQTQNFLAVISPPYGKATAQDAIDWTNGLSTERTSAINSSYAAIYWPWVKVFSPFDGKDRWLAPEIFACRQMAYTDNVADSWFAPAGFRRGRLTKPTDVEVVLSKGERDTMYSGGNAVNPIQNFPQQGMTIWGQRTAQREPTALDRINVRRLMIFLRKVILLATRRFVFEPNDQFTWEQIQGVLEPMLSDIMARRGITQFRVVCDETTNTSIRIDRNELWCKILVKPTKTAEMLVFEINLTNQSAKLGSL